MTTKTSELLSAVIIVVGIAIAFIAVAITGAIKHVNETASQPKIVAQDTPRIIPLSKIWAYRMPGTLSIRALARESVGLTDILSDLNKPLRDGEKIGPAFIVTGTPRQMLVATSTFIGGYQPPPQILPANTDLTLVFYCRPCPWYILLHAVERSEKLVTVKYFSVPRHPGIKAANFALIPLGKFSDGMVQVEVEHMPYSSPSYYRVDGGLEFDPPHYVSGPFSFEVR